MVELFQKTAALEASAWGLPLFPWKATCFVCSLVGVRKSPQILLVPFPDSGECCFQSLSISMWSGWGEPLEASSSKQRHFSSAPNMPDCLSHGQD